MKNEHALHNELRRRARRLDMYVSKSRARDSNRLDFGLFALINVTTNTVVCARGALGLHSCTLDEIAEHLARMENAASEWKAGIRRVRSGRVVACMSAERKRRTDLQIAASRRIEQRRTHRRSTTGPQWS